MQRLKDAICNSPALRCLDYESRCEVVLSIDTSVIVVGYFLSQEGEDGKRYPNRFSSISLTEVESRYSQAKLELYGLFRALRAVRIFIFGVANLTVEMDAKFVKNMINNPDLQPNATINRWIAGILLFSFRLVHVPAARHAAADGLSRRPPSDNDPPDEDDFEDWLDRAYSFSVTLLNDRVPLIGAPAHSSRIPPSIPFVSVSFCPPPGNPETNPVVPRMVKALQKETRIDHIRLFLEMQIRPPDLSDKEYVSFLNTATRFFLHNGSLYRREPHGRHQLVVPVRRRYGLIREAHDDLGHKGVFSVRTRLLLRFWWPMLVDDVKWYIRTCHECQIRQTQRIHIPPTVPVVGGLFHKVHIDTMVMPRSGGYRFIVQARCALTAYPEWRMLRSENAVALAAFIFEDILCRWGAISELITDNGSAFVQALDTLATRYGIRHIRISPYNSQANGIVERRHFDVREAIMKSTLGGELRWSLTTHSVFWAEHVTILKSTGLSPYFMVHGVKPLFPFDLAEATFLVPVPDTDPIPSTTLIAWRASQLQKRQEDINSMRTRVLQSRFASIRQFESHFKNRIRAVEYRPGDLVLVRNSQIEKELNRKMKPRYLGPMVVLRRTPGGSYLLAELDGAISKLWYAAFRLIPYFPRTKVLIPVTDLTGLSDDALDEYEAEEDIEREEVESDDD